MPKIQREIIILLGNKRYSMSEVKILGTIAQQEKQTDVVRDPGGGGWGDGCTPTTETLSSRTELDNFSTLVCHSMDQNYVNFEIIALKSFQIYCVFSLILGMKNEILGIRPSY